MKDENGKYGFRHSSLLKASRLRQRSNPDARMPIEVRMLPEI